MRCENTRLTCFSYDNKYFIFLDNYTLNLWHLVNNDVKAIPVRDGICAIYCLSMYHLFTIDRQGKVFIFGIYTKNVVHKYDTDPDPYVALSPDRTMIAMGHENNGLIKITDVMTNELLFKLDHLVGTTAICWSADSAYIVAGGKDGSIDIWDGKQYVHHYSVKGHTDAIVDLCFFPDNEKFASRSLDKTINIWNITSRCLCHTIQVTIGKCTKLNCVISIDNKIDVFLKKIDKSIG